MSSSLHTQQPICINTNIPYTSKQLELFQSTKIGDIVWAKMPMKEKKIKRVELSHRVRPYLIVGKTEDELVGYPCSSKFKKHLENFHLNNKIHKEFHKSGFVYFCELRNLPIENLIRYSTSLENYELKQINRIITRVNYRYVREFPYFENLSDQKVGDIIQIQDEKYLIVKEEHKKFICFKVESKFHKDLMYIDEGNFCISLENYYEFNVDAYTTCNSLTLKTIEKVLDKYSRVNHNKIYFDYKFGCLFRDDYDLYFYVYSKDDNKYCLSINDLENGLFKLIELPEFCRKQNTVLSSDNMKYILTNLKKEYSEQYEWVKQAI